MTTMDNRLMVVQWLPRVAGVLFTLLIGLFVFDTLLGIRFLIHLIPALAILATTLVCWNHPIQGGTFFLVLGFIFTAWFNLWQDGAFWIVVFLLFAIGLASLLAAYVSHTDQGLTTTVTS